MMSVYRRVSADNQKNDLKAIIERSQVQSKMTSLKASKVVTQCRSIPG